MKQSTAYALIGVAMAGCGAGGMGRCASRIAYMPMGR